MASYEQNKDSKLWSVRFRAMEGKSEKHKRLSGYKTKKDAKLAYENYIIVKEKPQTVEAPNMIFKELEESYLAHIKKDIKDSSYFDTKQKIEKQILPFFSDKLVSDITPVMVDEWHSTISKYKYSYKYKLHQLLASILNYGECYFDLKNIMKKVHNFKKNEADKEMLYWTIDEFKKFIDAVDNVMYNTMFTFLYLSGCRKGEMAALSWNDIDYTNKTVKVDKSVTRKNTNGDVYAVTTPKTRSSKRVIEMTESFMNKLKEYQDWQSKNYDCTDFVFGGKRPLPEQTVLNRFNYYCRKAGVKKIRIHDLRHSCASLLISKGVSIVAVSKRLGHKDIKMTLNTYSHLMPEDQTQMLKVLSKV